MSLKFLSLMLSVSFLLVSCVSNKTSYQDREFFEKQETQRYDRASRLKRSEVLVKVDSDFLERSLKRTLDKRKVETSMVPSPPVPIIVPAKVIRVLIYPYIDSDGNFHGPSYLYTEIEKSRWVVGDFNDPGDGVYERSFTILEK